MSRVVELNKLGSLIIRNLIKGTGGEEEEETARAKLLKMKKK
jgi:hypothetical protein